MKPVGKCFCKNCEDCHWLWDWDMTNKETGLRENKKRCLFQVLGQEIPKITGALDGLQSGVNESRNRSMETKEVTKRFGLACSRAFQLISDNTKKLIDDR